MRSVGTQARGAAMALALLLVVAGCSGDAADSTAPTIVPSSTAPTSTVAPSTTGASTTEPAADVPYLYGSGVVPAPCRDAVNDGNACIYLGVIADLSGPFQHIGLPMTRAQEDFWRAVNQEGGIGGFDVIIAPGSFVDSAGDPAIGVEAAGQIAPGVAGMAQSSGIESTLEAIGTVFGANSVLVSPADRWSGWSSPDLDGDLALETGTSYCFAAMNGIHFMDDFIGGDGDGLPSDFGWAVVTSPGLYGSDYSVGARLAAGDLGWPQPLLIDLPALPGADALAAAAETITDRSVDLIVFATDPGTMAVVWASVWSSAAGTDPEQLPLALGASPTWRESFKSEADLMFTLVDRYYQTSPWEGWVGASAGHQAMRSAAELSGEAPSHGYVAGWISQYPWKALITAAAESGDLTRANLVGLVRGLEVDFDGMIPPVAYGDAPGDVRSRQTVVNRASADAADGLTPVTPPFSSSFVQGFQLTASCSEYAGE
jgi:hypothetical protein